MTSTTTEMAQPNKKNPEHRSPTPRALKMTLANLRDELELFGWRPEDTSRYARQALRALPIENVVAIFKELVAEERSYYSHHSVLRDDQLDHTMLPAS